MRISDWSSDVCPSDLLNFRRLRDEGRLTLYPQPIMDIRGPEPRLAKAEFLMRMRMRDGYQSLPPDTVETLEYFGLTPELDAFSAQIMLNWIDENPQIVAQLDGLTMNLSAHSLADARFMQRLFNDVRAVHPPVGKLGFEITETAAIAQLEIAADIIEDFRSIGRSEEHTSELQSLMRISYAVFCLKKKTQNEST